VGKLVFNALTSVLAQHDPDRLCAALVVCLCASFIALRLYGRMRASRGVVRAAWLLLAGAVAGVGAWSTHFLAVLAYAPAQPLGFVLDGTLYSLLAAVGAMLAGFWLAGAGQPNSRSHAVAAGLVFGLGVAAMQYLGMKAVVFAGQVIWSTALVGLSVALAIGGFTAAAMATRDAATPARQIRGGVIAALAVFALHMVGMAAVTLVDDPTAIPPATLVSNDILLLAVVALTVMTILGGVGVAVIEQHLTTTAQGRMHQLADAAHEGLVVMRDGRIEDANLAFCEMASAPLDALVGRRLEGVLLTYDGGPRADGGREARLQPANDQTEIPVTVHSRVLESIEGADGRPTTVLAVRDLRERRAAEEKIRYLAEHDGLTGLANRPAMHLRLDVALDQARASGERLALICIDLDRFKESNDLHGHHVGDGLLVEAARRLRQCVAAPSFVARLGGDEFVVVQKGPDQPAAAAALAAEIIEAFSAPMTIGGAEIALGASLGVSLFPDDGDTGETLLANADMALDRAKEQGRGGYCFFKRDMDQAIRERRALARDLKRGLEADELVVFYQPLARASDGGVCGFEALVRWRHPQLGLMPPLDFIGVAEESGLIGVLGDYVLRRACAEAAGWTTPHRIAVNLSPLQLQDPGLPALVHEVLLSSGLSPARLELEITESALFRDYQRALDNLRRLKALGVRIAMDDFGTGYSSLSTLQSFPFDKIKIDKSFVEQIHREGRATAIVRAVLGLGRSLGIPVVAEGVETDAQLAFLRTEGCDELQGFAIGRPSPADALGRWLQPRGARVRKTRKAA
jgi:diguanylate cyclase (GGDEF)-like protein